MGPPLVAGASCSASAVGALVGAWQGFWVAYVGVPAFIVTLAGMLLFRGANQFVGNVRLGAGARGASQVIGAGYLPEVGPEHRLQQPDRAPRPGCSPSAWSSASPQPPASASRWAPRSRPLWVMRVRLGLICAAIIGRDAALRLRPRRARRFPISGHHPRRCSSSLYGFITNSTVIGRHIYAVGGNRHAAELSGVKSKKVNFLVMMNMSILAALAGMIFVARSTASGPQDGVGWELDAIAAVFIGGAAVTGGVGTVSRLHRRRPRHGRAQQRPAAQGHRRRRDPDDQGPRAPRRRRLRRLQQVARAASRSSAC